MGTFAAGAAYIGPIGEPGVSRRDVGPVDGVSMQIELYRVIHWLAVAALVVWTVYSAYSAIALS